MKNAGLYIHVPFCSSKCNYCDFNSYAEKLNLAEEYFHSMKKEVEIYKGQLAKSTINTIFIGGGTPSCVDENFIADILDFCHGNYNISKGCEVSIESNPGTLTFDKLILYKQSGINRISIGLQSYQNNLLKYLGRKHTGEDFISSVELAKKAGFENINADVIFGIPGQGIIDWKETLEALVKLNITHISAYGLKIEEGTSFGDMQERGELVQVDDELDREMYHYAIKYLKDNGYVHYEISNFAKQGYECRHNLTYWKGVEYLGIGAGAHSYLNSTRFSNKNTVEEYIKCLKDLKKPVVEELLLDINDKMSEFMFLGLRLIKGVYNKEFKSLFSQDIFKKYQGELIDLEQNKLIKIEGENIKLTALGLDLANQVFMRFV